MKEETKTMIKKIWTIVLTIYLTIVTLACALFGYLYFSSKSSNGSKISFADAKTLVNTVCVDLGIASTGSTAKIDSYIDNGDYKNWDGTTIPLLDSNSTTISGTMIKQALSFANDVFNYNIKEGVYYDHPDHPEAFSYTLTSNGVMFSLIPVGNSDESEKYYEGTEITITGKPEEWKISSKIKFTTSGGENYNLLASIGEYEKDSSGVYKTVDKAYIISTTHVDGRDDVTSNLSSKNDLSKFSAYAYMEYNTKTHKTVQKYDNTSYQNMDDKENVVAFTDAESVEFLNEMIKAFQAVNIGTSSDFANVEVVAWPFA